MPPEAPARRARWWAPRPHEVLVVGMAAHVAVFGRLGANQHRRFGTFGFDMGIFDQGIWLLSQFEDPFVTVRGLNYFGNHLNLGTVLFVPFYWLGAGPVFLSVAQTVVVALGAVPIWLLGRDRLASGWLALGVALAFLLHPATEWISWWQFHPDALAITPLLFAYWFASRRRWRWFGVCVALTLVWKEDAAMAVFALGLVLVVTRRWRAGLVTSGVALVWFLLATEVLIPRATGGLGPFYGEFYSGFGDGAAEIAFNMARHPSRFVAEATEPATVEYYRRLFLPVGLLALAAPVSLGVALPHLVVNTVSSHPLTHDIRYQYSSLIIAAIFLATVEAIAWMGRRRSWRAVLVVVVLVSAVLANRAWSPSPLGVAYRSGIWVSVGPNQAAAEQAVGMVPAGAGVSATFQLVPHLTHRARIYEFPNPWKLSYWGVKGENPPDPLDVDYLVVDTASLGASRALYDSLVGPGRDFQVVFSSGTIAVARRGPALPG
ncbi:MAG: DUF2079 domain-containing protein [Acidimicrobiales bacterium]